MYGCQLKEDQVIFLKNVASLRELTFSKSPVKKIVLNALFSFTYNLFIALNQPLALDLIRRINSLVCVISSVVVINVVSLEKRIVLLLDRMVGHFNIM